MRTALILVFTFLLLSTFNIYGQYVKDSQEKALEYLAAKKTAFQNAANDSVFIVQNGDGQFKYYTFHRGDQEEDIEEQVYGAKTGDVVGPFKGGDSSAFLFKVISYEQEATRSKAKLIYIRSNKESQQDTASVRKLTEKYFAYISKGKDVKIRAHKEEVRLVFKDLGWFYEGGSEEDKKKEYFDLVTNMGTGDTSIIETEQGPAILQVLNSKEKTHYKVKLVAVIKRGE